MLKAIPFWVPALFLFLLFVGYRQSLTREVRPGTLAAIAAAMFGLSLYGVASTFGATPAALLAWVLGYGLAVVIGARWFSSSAMTRAGALVRVAGSWIPLGLMLGIFAAKFFLGFATGMRLPMLHEIWFIAAMGAVLGALSGVFGARALAVYRFAGASARTRG